MAKNKKSFIMYSDYDELFEELSDKDAGQLIKHVLRYVNDLNPETSNPMVKISFIGIKQALKRDLKKFEGIKLKRSVAGKKSAEKRAIARGEIPTSVDSVPTNPTSVESVQQTSTNPTVSDNVNDSDSVNDNDNDNDVFHTIDNNFEKYLKNERLIKSIIENKKNGFKDLDHLQKRLIEFNSTLKETGVHAKTWHDYTSHFRNWNLKTKDLVPSKQSKSDAEAEIEALIHKNPNRK